MPCKPLYCTYGKLVIPQRYVLCFMIFCATLLSYAMRTSLHIAITEMAIALPKANTSKGEVCPDVDDHTVVKGGTYNWTEKQQGLILSAFFPGYVISHLPGGFMAHVFGAKHIISGGIALSGLFTVLTPLAVKVGDWWLLMVIRFVIGLSQGPVVPCLSSLLSKWVPLRERTGLGAFVATGNQIGSIAGNLVSSMLMAYVNWPIVFYFWGIMALIWYVIFFLTCYSQPSQHPFMTPEEAQMLQQEIGNVAPGVFVVIASYLGCERIPAAAMFILGMFVMGPFYAGMKVNILDITKNFAGIMMAIVNGIGALAFVPVPYFTALLTPDQTIEQWRLVFWVLFAACTAFTLIYVALTSGERADWDKAEGER